MSRNGNRNRLTENRHHTQWEKRQWWRDSVTRRMREHPGMIIKLPIDVHNELHQEIRPIAPPHHTLGLIALAHLRAIDSIDPYIVIPKQTDYLWRLADRDSQVGHEAFKYADHLEQQIAFLDSKAIELRDVD